MTSTPLLDGTESFSKPSEQHVFDGLLFDMDGTIVDSTEAVVKHWHKLGKQLGVDPEVILATSHGRRSIDTLEIYDKSLANWEYVSYIEGLIPREYGKGAKEIPGARSMLARLDEQGVPWAIVTSGTTTLVEGWLDVMDLARPKNLVVAEDVPRGKPDPACYLLGREKLGLKAAGGAMLVLEDAPSGVRAGKAAGFKVVALATTHKIAQLRDAGADWIVRDMRSVQLKEWNSKTGKATIEIRQALDTDRQAAGPERPMSGVETGIETAASKKSKSQASAKAGKGHGTTNGIKAVESTDGQRRGAERQRYNLRGQKRSAGESQAGDGDGDRTGKAAKKSS